VRGLAFVLLCSLYTASAAANGRMPGANDVVFSTSLPTRLITRATYGILESDDRGASWRWICEQAIDVSGVISDPPLGLLHDGTEVLLPPTGSALVSQNGGCSWTRVGAPLANKRGADLTIDPSAPSHLLVLTSTLRATDTMGIGSYENQLIETADDAASWQLLATLPTDFEAETVEVARSDPQRIYVSGADAARPRLGVILRSEDGGATWTRSTLDLPAGTGSLWISGIHPTDPNKLWLRVSARGDTLGLLPARLFASSDKGATFQQLATTNKGMFGFALSPDGSQLAYGGPFDGMFVGPSDGSAFEKRNALGITCLRWPAADALYACASEPADPFSVGVSRDQGMSFQPLFKLSDSCPAACAAGTSFALTCEAAWSATQQQLAASRAAPMCSLPWSVADAGMEALDAGAARDAGTLPPLPTIDAGVGVDAGRAEAKRDDGCSLAGREALGSWLALLLVRRRRRR
jgi:photosystem II stability/assembly factor-like uncharacterized protein